MKILFTGPSGINAEEALRRLARAINHRTPPRLLKFEHYLTSEHIQGLAEFGWKPQEVEDERERLSLGGSLQFLLLLPKPYLRTLWRRAFAVWKRASDEDPSAMLFIHAIYYQTQNREFFICSSGELLRTMKVDRVITLIDDIYDVHARLRADGQVYSDNALPEDPSDRTFHRLFQLTRILEWRSKEILAAEKLSSQLNASHIVLATKHPLAIARALATTAASPIYVSHPISEVRRLRADGETAAADQIENEINQLTRGLQVRPEVMVPVFPTSIDEYIISKEEKPDGTAEFLPRVEPRWSWLAPEKELLFVAPKDPPAAKNPLDIEGLFYADDGAPKAGLNAVALDSVKRILNHVLREAISEQVDSRDHHMVDQSLAIAVYRPYFLGNVSRGVMEEVQYRTRRYRYRVDENPRPCVIYCPQSDLAACKVLRLAEALTQQGVSNRLGRIEKRVLVRKAETQLEEAVWQRLGNRVFRAWSGAETRQVCTSLGLPTKKFQKPGGGALDPEVGTEVADANAKMWKELAKALNGHPLEAELLEVDEWIDEDMTAGQFAERVQERVTLDEAKDQTR